MNCFAFATATAQPLRSTGQVISSRTFVVRKPLHHVARRPRHARHVTCVMNVDPVSGVQNTLSFMSHYPSIAMPLHSLAVNEKLYADIIKGSFAIIFATLLSVVIVGLIVRKNLDKLEEDFQNRFKDKDPPRIL